MKTNVYVDGFNLYYGCLKKSPYRWLNIAELCRIQFPNNQINRIRYFTAPVVPSPRNPDQRNRQVLYQRALLTLPNLTIKEGRFQSKPCRLPYANPPVGGPATVEVIRSEEKGSDVNIATYLLLDAFEKDCDAAIVISNDSDLAEPISVARRKLHIKVALLLPLRRNLSQQYWPQNATRKKLPWPSVDLHRTGAVAVEIQERALAASQFPNQLTDAVGTFSKPSTW